MEHEHAHMHSVAEDGGFLAALPDILQDAAVDTLYLIPFLLVTYLVMEWLEHRTGDGAQRAIQRAGIAGPAIGALLGVVPQCGFSAAASTLYAARVVSLGTLFAVFLATSDEMLPIFIAEQVPLDVILPILGAKVLIGMVFGFAVDAVMRVMRHGAPSEELEICDLCEHDHCQCGHEHGHGHGTETESEHAGHHIVRSAVWHTAQVTLFVFLVSLVLNAVLALVGEEALHDFLGANEFAAVFGSALVGLIPNCAASVAIAQLYIEGVLSAGAMMAGLLSAAGVGLLVLLRTNRRPVQNAAIVAVLFALSAVCGLVIGLFV